MHPKKFPHNNEFTKWCVILYFLVSSIIQAIQWVFYQDIVMVSLPKTVAKGQKSYFRMKSYLPRTGTMTEYTLVFKVIAGKQVSEIVKKIDIQEFFNVEGFFNEKKYWMVVQHYVKDLVSRPKTE